MSDWLVYVLIAVGVSFVVAALLFVGIFLLLLPKGMPAVEGLRIIPNVFRLLRKLSKERGLGGTVKVCVLVLFVYLVSPVDLIPDVFPVVGSVDDVLLFGAVLRTLMKAAGPETLQRAWPGSEASLAYLTRLLRLRGVSERP